MNSEFRKLNTIMKKKLSDMTIDELNKRKNTLKGAMIGISIVMIIAYGILLYLVIKSKNFVFLTIIPSGFLTLIPIIMGLKQIDAEIKSRLSDKSN